MDKLTASFLIRAVTTVPEVVATVKAGAGALSIGTQVAEAAALRAWRGEGKVGGEKGRER